MFRLGYTQAAPSFSMPNFSLAPYTPEGNGQAYANANDNYQAPYSTVAYTDPISLPDNSAGFLSNHAYHKVTRYIADSQSETVGFGYKTPPQFPFRPQPIDITLDRAMTEPCADPNNLTNQLAAILCESFDIEPKGRGASIKNPTLITMTNSLMLEVIGFPGFLCLVGRMRRPH
jgi:hypothetical protein